MASVAELLQELEQEARVTRVVLERVPADGMDWRPHEKSMSLGELALHVATVPGAIARMSREPSFDVRTPTPSPEFAGSEALLAAHDESVATAAGILRGMQDADLQAPFRFTQGDGELMAVTRGALLRSLMLNHVYHHRGQLTVYLRQVGVPVPAVYGPSADENPFAR